MNYKELVEELLRKIKVENIDSEDFIRGGVLTSFDILELVDGLEEQLDIEIQLEEILPENFKNVACIAAFVERKAGETA